MPYEARIVCTPLDGTYTYELPDGSTISSADSELEVLIDDLSWEIKVTWTNGEDVLVDTATAEGTNARPRIFHPRISGSPELWYLEPRERTLIDRPGDRRRLRRRLASRRNPARLPAEDGLR